MQKGAFPWWDMITTSPSYNVASAPLCGFTNKSIEYDFTFVEKECFKAFFLLKDVKSFVQGIWKIRKESFSYDFFVKIS